MKTIDDLADMLGALLSVMDAVDGLSASVGENCVSAEKQTGLGLGPYQGLAWAVCELQSGLKEAAELAEQIAVDTAKKDKAA